MQTNKALWQARNAQGITKETLAQDVRAGKKTHTLDSVEVKAATATKKASKDKGKNTETETESE